MKITSPVFKHNEAIPSKYTCDGNNVNPPLVFREVPAGAQSLVLIMDDPDIPAFVKEKMGIEVFDHWIIYNIPPETSKLSENSSPLGLEGKNSSGSSGYTGPCPPDQQHRYFFKLYALDKFLDLAAGATRQEVETAVQGHVLAEAELIGLYERQE